MRLLFADTLYWVAPINPRDPGYAAVAAIANSLRDVRIVTTEEALVERLTADARATAMKQAVARSGQRPRSDRLVEGMPQTPESLAMGLALDAQRLDQGYSRTDCISRHTMRARGMDEILTAAERFPHEGLAPLIRR